MARFLAALLAAAAVLAVQVAQLSQAAPSTSELFRRAMLPDSTLPDAVLRILRPGTNLNERKDSGAATLAGEPPAFDYDYKGSGKRHGAAAGKTKPFAAPYNYGYQGSGKRHGAAAGGPAAPYNYCYHGSSKRHGSGAAGEPSPFGYSYRRSQKRPTGVATAKDDPFEYEYHAGGGATDASARPSPATTVFFHEEAVRVGERLPFHFPPAAPAALGFLPRSVADSVPFSTAALPDILALLGVAPGSAMAGRMEQTLSACESPAIAREAKFCATSLEAMVELAAAALGTRDVTAVASVLPRCGAPPQPYAVRAVRRLDGSSFLACHDEPYPYTVYRCHTTGPARAYMVEMESAAAAGGGGGGGAVTVATVCHTDTSQWNPEHVSFKLLGTKPGGAPVCHLMPYGHIIWAKNVKRSPS